MRGWYSWLVNLNVVKWYLNALFDNEMRNNGEALHGADFHELQVLFGWQTSISMCAVYLGVIYLVMRILTYFAIRYINHSSA